MKRLIVLAGFLAFIGCAAFGLFRWDTDYRFYSHSGWMKIQYQLNKDAFERISKKLSEDPLIDSVGYYSPGWPQPIPRKPIQLTDPVDQAAHEQRLEDVEAQQSRYEPFLADLKFLGSFSFSRNENDPRLTQTIGPSGDFGYVVMQSWLIHADGTDTLAPPCPSKPLDLPSGDCAEHLGGEWWMRYIWITGSPSN